MAWVFRGATVGVEFVQGSGVTIDRSLKQKAAIDQASLLRRMGEAVVTGIRQRVQRGADASGHPLRMLAASTLQHPRQSPHPLAASGAMLAKMIHSPVSRNEESIRFADTASNAKAFWNNRGTKAHAIAAKRKTVLRFIGADGAVHFRRVVKHPRVAARRFFAFAAAERDAVLKIVQGAMRG